MAFILFLLSLVYNSIETPHQIRAQSACAIVVGQGEAHATVQSALGAITTTKRTICVKDNKTYGRETISISGSTASPIVIRSHPDNTKKPKFQDTDPFPPITVNNYEPVIKILGSHLILEELEVSRSSGIGISSFNNSNVTLKNVDVHDTYNHGIKAEESPEFFVTGATVHRTTLKGTVTDCIKTSGCKIPEVIMIKNSQNGHIENSRVFDDGSPGKGGVLTAYRSDGVVFKNNEVYHVQGNSMHIDNSDNVLYENNLIYETCESTQTLGNGLYKLSERGKEQATWQYYGSKIILKNNLIIHKNNGINFGGCQEMKAGDVCPLNDVTIQNNTIIGARDFALRFSSHTQSRNIKISNNIFHDLNNDQPDASNALPLSSLSFANNIWSSKPSFASSDKEIAQLNNVFAKSFNLATCVSAPLDITRYAIASTYSGIGADISKIGTDKGGFTPPPPAENWDLDNDSDVDVFDFNQFMVKVMKKTESWSKLASFIAAFQ
jgi:hypothetical protein